MGYDSGMRQKFHTRTFENISPEKREKILSIAVSEFADLGFTNANTNEIARKAQISVGSLYKYFPTKEDFFLSVVNFAEEQLEAILKDILDPPSPLEEKIEKIIRTILHHSRINRNLIKLYNEMTSQKNTDLIKRLSTQMESISAQYYKEMIREAKIQGTIPEDIDEDLQAFLLDNLFITLQFSYSCDYYRERMKIYAGDTIEEEDERVVSQTMQFIKRAFSLK
jgi:TetR/AcrR family transcriptional regulator